MANPFKRDSRSAAVFARYHQRSRLRNPRLQALMLVILAPLLGLLVRLRIGDREHLFGLRSRMTVIGRENLPEGAYIVAPNHPSVLDPLLVATALRQRIHFMGKSELFSERWGKWLNRLGAFPVRRGVWDDEAFATAEQVLARGKVMCMFPEGGVSPPDGYRKARGGVGYLTARSGVPVVPVHISGPRALYRGWRKPWSWPRLRVVIGPPLHFAQDDNPDRQTSQRIARDILDVAILLKDYR